MVKGRSQDSEFRSQKETVMKAKWVLWLVIVHLTSWVWGSSITVQVDEPGAKVSPLLWGIFLEDINHAIDGGLYPELVRNRSFENSDIPEYWDLQTEGWAKAEMTVDSSRPLNPYNRKSLRVQVRRVDNGSVTLVNEGFWGMAVQQGEPYHLSLAARCDDSFQSGLEVTLVGANDQVLANGHVQGLTHHWQTFTLELNAAATESAARLQIVVQGKGTIWLDMVSLMPEKIWKQSGLRPDLAEMLVGLKPAFLRFPGGCWVEGHDLAHAYQWKETIGDITHRKPLWNLWQYHATHGVGYHEYLLMCEDLDAEPLFVINCGMSHTETVPMDQMGPFVQDALDAIEYANGPIDSVWGRLRAQNGHPESFYMKMIQIGNENGGPDYQERFALFYDAIKFRYPLMTIVSCVPTTERRADIIDEHYYSNPEYFMQHAARYDTYERDTPPIYVGEYAVTQECGQGNLAGALGEAAFMTGLERNADHVVMASYAPLFVNVNDRRWNPDLINFDSSRVYGLPSYYVQQLFSEQRGDVILPIEVDSPLLHQGDPGGRIGVGTWATQAEFKDLKVVRDGEVLYASDFGRGLDDWTRLAGEWITEDGCLRQESGSANVRAVVGDVTWSNYTYSLKARKLGGEEGFLILFRVQDENSKCWWNIGGWNNERHAIEMGGVVGDYVPGHIETGRWYDIRIELEGHHIRCYLDDDLIHDLTYPTIRTLYASALQDSEADEIVLKVVNVSEEPQATQVNFKGAGTLASKAQGWLLTSNSLTDENSLDDPTKVATQEIEIDGVAETFEYTFKPRSLTVMRIKKR